MCVLVFEHVGGCICVCTCIGVLGQVYGYRQVCVGGCVWVCMYNNDKNSSSYIERVQDAIIWHMMLV